MIPPYVHRTESLGLHDVALLIPNTLRALMAWRPSLAATRIQEMVWVQEHLGEEEGGLRGKYVEFNHLEGRSYMHFPPVGGGRFMRELPDDVDVASSSLMSVELEEDYKNPMVLNLQRYRGLIEGTELETHYSEPIERVLQLIVNDSFGQEAVDVIRRHMEKPSESPGRQSNMDSLSDLFSNFQIPGEMLGYFLIITNFGQAFQAGMEKFAGRTSFSVKEVGRLANGLGLYLSLHGAAHNEKDNFSFMRKTAIGLVEGFSAPTFEPENFLIRNLTVRSLGEYLYSSGVRLVDAARASNNLHGFYSNLYYAYPKLMAAFICFDRAVANLSGEDQVKVARDTRLADEWAARVSTAMQTSSLIPPETFWLITATKLLEEARRGGRHLNIALVEIFDTNFMYPEYFRGEMLAEISRHKGGEQFSDEFSAFVREQFRGVPRG